MRKFLSKYLSLILQVSGIVSLVFLAVTHWNLFTTLPVLLFSISFVVHFIGDVIFLLQEGLPTVGLNFNIDEYVKLPAWLQFVGLILCMIGGVASGHWYSHPLVIFGFGVSLAGFVYDKIYP